MFYVMFVIFSVQTLGLYFNERCHILEQCKEDVLGFFFFSEVLEAARKINIIPNFVHKMKHLQGENASG